VRRDEEDSWYFPDENRERVAPIINTDLETPEDIIVGNINWLENLVSNTERSNAAAANVSPLTWGNINHTVRWNGNNTRVTLTPTEGEEGEQEQQRTRIDIQRSALIQPSHSGGTHNTRTPLSLPRPPPRDLAVSVPLSSAPDVNENLEDRLAEHNRRSQLAQNALRLENSATTGAAAGSYANLRMVNNCVFSNPVSIISDASFRCM